MSGHKYDRGQNGCNFFFNEFWNTLVLIYIDSEIKTDRLMRLYFKTH